MLKGVLALVAGIVWAVPVCGQPLVTYVGSSPLPELTPRLSLISAHLEKLGLRSDKDFRIEARSYNNDSQTLPSVVTKVLADSPRVVYAAALDAAREFKKQTTTVPIVFAARANLESPAFRIVDNLGSPEANLTGFTRYVNLVPKKLQLMKEAFPSTVRIGYVYGVEIREERRREYEAAASKVGVTLNWRKFEKADLLNLGPRLNETSDDAFIVAFDDLLVYNRSDYVAQASKVKRPLIYPEAATDKGVVMHYVPVIDGEAKAAEYIAKILRGAKIKDLAVQEPQDFELSVNMTTLKRNGLTMSRDVLSRAHKVE